jgi:hypothetical protein
LNSVEREQARDIYAAKLQKTSNLNKISCIFYKKTSFSSQTEQDILVGHKNHRDTPRRAVADKTLG